MELPLRVASKFEVRAVIRYFTATGDDASAIHRKIHEVYGDVISIQMVRRWRQQFLDGRTDVSDEPRSGRPSEINADTINTVRFLIESDRRCTEAEIERYFDEVACNHLSHGTIVKIIHEELEMSKVCARWVPKLLTDEHKKNRMAAAIDLLSLYCEEGEKLFDRIVTGDEKWVHHYTPEMKSASRQWKTTDDPTPVKAKNQRSAGKVLLTTFWDAEGILLEEYMEPKQTVNQETYFDTLMRLRQAIKHKRPGKLSEKVLLIHDNARPHTAKLIQLLLRDFKWQIFAHPAHSPDLAPSDYHLFPNLHCHLGGRRFSSDAAVQQAVHKYFVNLDASFYASGIAKLVSRYDKCLNLYGSYVEK